ncbi:MAG: TatD family hydrolase, partial [Muribaculaceae bacterium]|nr:TatD family hydrolase [Muribaculaceae bacterium]
MIDTHTHIYDTAFGSPEGSCEAVDRALAAGVDMMILPNVDLASIEPIKALHAARPQATAMAMGLHPTELGSDWRASLDPIEA